MGEGWKAGVVRLEEGLQAGRASEGGAGAPSWRAPKATLSAG